MVNTSGGIDSTIYRKTKYCNTCPFKDNGKAMLLKEGRVDMIKQELLETGNSFSCHKTVYDLDDDLSPTGHQEIKMCYGAYKFLLDEGKPCQIMQVAERLGVKEI